MLEEAGGTETTEKQARVGDVVCRLIRDGSTDRVLYTSLSNGTG
jgi:hypothetical protein